MRHKVRAAANSKPLGEHRGGHIIPPRLTRCLPTCRRPSFGIVRVRVVMG